MTSEQIEMEREWLPAEYIDASIPPCHPSPNDWIEQHEDGKFYLGSGNYYNDGEKGRLLIEGETINFQWTRDLGTAELTVNPDRSWQLHGAVPAAPEDTYLNIWVPGDPESASPDIDTIAEHLALSDWGREGISETIKFNCWSADIAYKFTAGAFHKINA